MRIGLFVRCYTKRLCGRPYVRVQAHPLACRVMAGRV